jgi:hypothetical protein
MAREACITKQETLVWRQLERVMFLRVFLLLCLPNNLVPSTLPGLAHGFTGRQVTKRLIEVASVL